MQTGVKTSYRKAIIMVLLYLSFVFKNLFLNSANSRAVPYVMSGLGYFSSGSYMVISHIIMAAYSVVACFIGIFLINIVLERTGRMFMPSGQMFYGLAFYTAIANVFIGLISLLYYINPLIAVFGEDVVPVLCYTVTFSVMFVKLRKHIPDYMAARAFATMVIPYGVYAFAITLIMGVIGM